MQADETLGKRIRSKREQKNITLRKFAKLIGVSPTYLSQVERDEQKSPTEETISKIAENLDDNLDELLALADRLPSDIPNIIQKHPVEVATFLRTAKGFSKNDWQDLTNKILERSKKGSKNDD